MCDEMEFNDWMVVAIDDKCEHMDDTTYCWSSAVILMHRIRALQHENGTEVAPK